MTFPGIQHSPNSPRSPHSVPRSCIPGFIHRRVYLDISRAFDKSFHIIFKLKQNGISGKLLSALPDVLKDRKQRVLMGRC